MADARNLEFVQRIRELELDCVLPLLPPRCRILEIGAGSGWQATALAGRGHRVEAIDVEGSTWTRERVWPVAVYDGVRIPFEAESFDVVFSSNVLEHIPHVEDFQREILRVLRPGGIAVHLLPTATWRIWTILSFYPRSLWRTLAALIRRARSGSTAGAASDGPSGAPTDAPAASARRPTGMLRQVLVPPRHGERGNLITEIFWFSRFRWLPLFRRAGWRVRPPFPTRLFYTGGVIHGSCLGLRTRRLLSRFLGSACLVYVLEKPPDAQRTDDGDRVDSRQHPGSDQ